MKIVHLALASIFNDNFGYQENLIAHFNKKDGHEVTIITSRLQFSLTNGKPYIGKLENYVNDEGIKIVRLDYKKGLLYVVNKLLRRFKGTYNILEQETPDLIFFHSLQSWDILNITKYIKKHPKCKLIADNHAIFENSARNWFSKNILHRIIWRIILKKSLKYIDKVYCITPGAMKFASQLYNIPSQKMEYLYLGANTDNIDFENQDKITYKYRKKIGISTTDFLIISGGKLNKNKRVDLLLDIFYEIKDENIKFFLFGPLDSEINNTIIKKINRDQRVIYVEWIDSNDIYNYFLASDLAVFIGNQSVLWQQAICCALPAIFSNPFDIEYLDLGGNAVVLNKTDKQTIKNHIKNIINNPTILDDMKKVAKKNGFKTFSYKEISRKAIKV